MRVGRWKDKYVIGLTGNIAMGKSLVRTMLSHLGAFTIDADGLTHQVMAPQAPAYKPLVETFGKFILAPDGQIDRARLGGLAFGYPEALKELEKITHPAIRLAIDTLIGRAKQEVVVVEAIKLLEGELGGMVDAVWVVDCHPQVQLKRLIERGTPEAEAKRRIAAQNPQQDKLSKAAVVIRNDGTREETWAQVQAAWAKIAKGQAATAATQSVTTVAVSAAPTAPPPPKPAAAPQAPARTPPPAPAASISSFNVRRPMPADLDRVAALINQVKGSNLTRGDIMARFVENTYIMAEANQQVVGVIAFVVENLVTRVNEFVVSPAAPVADVGKGLIQAMESASNDLQSEIAFAFLPTGQTDNQAVFQTAGYELTNPSEIRYPAWREAVMEHKPANTDMMARRLRESLVLKPI
jgi:dephospho-CoA kinase